MMNSCNSTSNCYGFILIYDVLEFSLMLVDFPVEWRSVGYGYLLNSSSVPVIVVLIMGILMWFLFRPVGVFCVCVFGRVNPLCPCLRDFYIGLMLGIF
jgi:hypothetical protein